MNPDKLAPGKRRATLSGLVTEKAALPPEMATRVEKAFGVSMDTLLCMQAWHDSYTMRQREGEEIHAGDRAAMT